MHLRHVFWGLFLIFFSIPVYGQNLATSPRQAVKGQVYRLNDGQAKMLAEGKKTSLDPSFFEDQFGTFPASENTKAMLPPGQYLSSKVVGTNLYWVYQQVPGFSVFVEEDGFRILIKVLDFDGEVITDAIVKMGAETFYFDARSNAYTSKKSVKPGFLEVEVGPLVQFYQIHQTTSREEYSGLGRLARAAWWKTFRWVVVPIRHTFLLPYDVVRSIARRRLFGWPNWIVSRSNALYQKLQSPLFRHPVQYMLCSQPKYRPADTVRVKAYLTNKRGFPLKQTLQLLYTDREGKTSKLQDVKPLRPGCYVAKFALSEELKLQLDRDVPLILVTEKKWKERPIPIGNQSMHYNGIGPFGITQFHYEDYELNQVELHARVEKARHWKTETPILFVEAKDKNGLTLPDARARIYALKPRIIQWLDQEAFLPDTLWSWTGNLDASGETRLEVSMDRFPNASFDYNFEIECLTSDNEMKKKSLLMTYWHDQDEIQIDKSGDSISISLLRNGNSIEAMAEIEFSPYIRNALPMKKWVRLPAMLNWPLNYSDINVKTERCSKYWSASQESSLSIYGDHKGDTIQIAASTLDQSTFTFHLYEEKKLIKTGNVTEFYFNAKAKRNKNYYLVVHRIIGGKGVSESRAFHWWKKELQVNWKGPSTIYPGMVADIEIEVKTAKGKPVKKADLTAYAINSKFENYRPPLISGASKPKKLRNLLWGYNVAYQNDANGNAKLEYDFWKHKAVLDTLLWYNFLFPDSNVFVYEHPIESNKTEIAPFVVRDGQIQPVQIVYIDGMPVYFAWTVPTVPYSFALSPGEHRIEMRLPDKGIKIDTFTVRAGYKTILSIDEDHIPKRIFAKEMNKKPVPGEAEIIRRNTFSYRGLPSSKLAFIAVGNRILKINSAGTNLSGPVGNNPLEIVDYGNYRHVLDYESGFEFDFGPQFVKMRTQNPNVYPKEFGYRPIQLIDDRPWDRDSLIADWNRRNLAVSGGKRNTFYAENGTDCDGRLRLDLAFDSEVNYSPVYLVIVNKETKKRHVFRYGFGSENKLPLGIWQAYIVFDDDRYVDVNEINIRANGLNYYRLLQSPENIQDSFWTTKAIPILYRPTSDSELHLQHRNGIEVFQQNRSMSGQFVVLNGNVVDAVTSEPLPFVTIVCKDFGIGTISDEKGHFTLSVPKELDVLQVISLGYARKEITWNGDTFLNIKLAEESLWLENVEVIGTSRIDREYLNEGVAYVDVKSVKSLSGVFSERSAIEIAGARKLGMRDIVLLNNKFSTSGLKESTNPEFPQELLEQVAGTSVIRKDFRDNAIWKPDLISSKNGSARFRLRFPDDITRWDAYAIAVDRRGKTGMTSSFIKSWKPISGRLSMPRFYYEGDTVNVIGKVLNYTSDTVTLNRIFWQNDRIVSERKGSVGPFVLDTLKVVPSITQDSFMLTYQANNLGSYGDGEAWKSRIFPQGLEQSEGVFSSFISDTVYRLPQFDKSRGPVYIRANSKLQSFLLVETAHLHNYAHLCNEQLASKLMGLLAEKAIFESMGRKWHGYDDVERVLRLFKNRLEPAKEGWGWWPGMPDEHWISLHVTKALNWAKKEGFSTSIKYDIWANSYLNRLQKDRPNNNLNLLEFVQEIDSSLNIQDQINSLDTFHFWSIHEQLRIMKMRQSAGMSIDVDSLMKLSRRDSYGQRYWPNSNSSLYRWSVSEGDVPNTLIAYQILEEAGKSQKELQPILSFLMSQRTSNGWGNTFITAKVLETLVPTIGRNSFNKVENMTISVNGVSGTYLIDSTIQFPAGEKLALIREGQGLFYFSAWQNWLEKKPEAIDSLFEVQTEFRQNGKLVNQLVAGQAVKMHIRVNVKHDGEFLNMDVPIPSSCSYLNKNTGYYASRNPFYREYFREKVVFYFRQLRQGEYEFEIELLPRYTGSFTLNPVRMENMYFPVLAGQNQVDRVEIH